MDESLAEVIVSLWQDSLCKRPSGSVSAIRKFSYSLPFGLPPPPRFLPKTPSQEKSSSSICPAHAQEATRGTNQKDCNAILSILQPGDSSPLSSVLWRKSEIPKDRGDRDQDRNRRTKPLQIRFWNVCTWVCDVRISAGVCVDLYICTHGYV